MYDEVFASQVAVLQSKVAESYVQEATRVPRGRGQYGDAVGEESKSYVVVGYEDRVSRYVVRIGPRIR